MKSKDTNSAQILDCTLRDGSYANGFNFTAEDTYEICQALANAGVNMIEVGHGVGLNASNKGYGEAAETDEGYLKSASRALENTNSKFGVFCIPNIAELKHVDLVADYNAGFIRIGVDVDEIEQSKIFIERAKSHNLFVALNLMKSYAIPPEEVAKKAEIAKQFGADLLYIVDSAGGMLRTDICAYFNAVSEASDIPLGFHGHNNLGLAVANSLYALELGAVIVDCTLQGYGRGAGNASTEMLVALLCRENYDIKIDPVVISSVGDELIKPRLSNTGHSSLDIICGYAQFHSSHMKIIRKYATKYKVDPRKLIIEVCKHNKIDAPNELVEQQAKFLRDSSSDDLDFVNAKFKMSDYIGSK